jgi:hypothetical protein
MHEKTQFVGQILNLKDVRITCFLEHILKKSALLKSLCRPSVRPSIGLSVSYFSAAMAPRDLKFST